MILVLKIMKYFLIPIMILVAFSFGFSLEYSYAYFGSIGTDCESWETRQETKKEYEELAKSLLSDWKIDSVIVGCNDSVSLTATIPQFSDNDTKYIVYIEPKYDLRKNTDSVNDFLENRNVEIEKLISKIKANKIFQEIDEKFVSKNIAIYYGSNEFGVSAQKNNNLPELIISLSTKNDHIFGLVASSNLELKTISVFDKAKKYAQDYFQESSQCEENEGKVFSFQNMILMYTDKGIDHDGIFPQVYTWWIGDGCSMILVKMNSEFELVEINDSFSWWGSFDESKFRNEEYKLLSDDSLKKILDEKVSNLIDWYYVFLVEAVRIDIVMEETINLHQQIDSEITDEQLKRKLHGHTIKAHSVLYSINEEIGNKKHELIRTEIESVNEIYSKLILDLGKNNQEKISPLTLVDLVEKSNHIQKMLNSETLSELEYSPHRQNNYFQFQNSLELVMDFFLIFFEMGSIIEELEERGFKVDYIHKDDAEDPFDFEIKIIPKDEKSVENTVTHVSSNGMNMLQTEFLLLASTFSSQGYASLSLETPFPNISNTNLDISENYQELAGDISTNQDFSNLQQEPIQELTPEILHDMIENIDKNYREFDPPLKQLKEHNTPKFVHCNNGLALVFKSTDGSPACVKSITAEKLIERGWTKDIEREPQ